MGSVRTSILGGPRPLPPNRHAEIYTLIWEEPEKSCRARSALQELPDPQTPDAKPPPGTASETMHGTPRRRWVSSPVAGLRRINKQGSPPASASVWKLAQDTDPRPGVVAR